MCYHATCAAGAVSYDGSLKAWDAASLELVMCAPGAHDGQRVHCLTVGPDKVLYTGGSDQVRHGSCCDRAHVCGREGHKVLYTGGWDKVRPDLMPVRPYLAQQRWGGVTGVTGGDAEMARVDTRLESSRRDMHRAVPSAPEGMEGWWTLSGVAWWGGGCMRLPGACGLGMRGT